MSAAPNMYVNADDLRAAAVEIVKEYQRESRRPTFTVCTKSLLITADFESGSDLGVVGVGVAPVHSPQIGINRRIAEHMLGDAGIDAVTIALEANVRALHSVAVEVIQACAPALRDTGDAS